MLILSIILTALSSATTVVGIIIYNIEMTEYKEHENSTKDFSVSIITLGISIPLFIISIIGIIYHF